MNYLRILRVTNILLLLSGNQLHWYDTRRYKLSLPGIVIFVLLACFYAICFCQHFEKSALLQLLHDVSPFLENLTRVQLLLGLKVLLFGLYEIRTITRAANKFLQLIPHVYAHKFQKDEAIAYALNFTTLLLGCGYIVYIAYEMEFKLPPMDHILIGGALFVPHFIIAGTLKFYNIYTWLTCIMLRNLLEDVQIQLEAAAANDQQQMAGVYDVRNVAPTFASKLYRNLQKQLQLLVESLQQFFEAVQRQIWLLFILNSHCLLAGVYAHVYYRNIWFIMFEERKRRIFYAANSAIFVLIGCDYLCLLLVQGYLEKMRSKFILTLDKHLQQPKALQCKPTCRILKDMRFSLRHGFQFKFFSCLRLNIINFIQLQLFLGIIIALIVGYHYLSDQMTSISTRLDSEDHDE